MPIINGRAWYDYGWSAWNPPMYVTDDGKVGIDDYDPNITRPGTWPILGPILLEMTWSSIVLILIPPTALIVSIATCTLALRLRGMLTLEQTLLTWSMWCAGLLPVLYMTLWGVKVFDWIAD